MKSIFNAPFVAVLMLVLVLIGYIVADTGSDRSDISFNQSVINNIMPRMETLNKELVALRQELNSLKANSFRNQGSALNTPIDTNQQTVNVNDEIGQLKSDINKIELQLASLSNTQVATKPVENQSNDVDKTAELEAKQIKAHFDNMENQIQSEDIDTTWAYSATDSINNAFLDQQLSGSQILQVDCRSKMCKVEVKHDNMEKMQDFEVVFPMKVGKALPRMAINNTQNTDGSVTSTIYLAKKDFKLPVVSDGEL